MNLVLTANRLIFDLQYHGLFQRDYHFVMLLVFYHKLKQLPFFLSNFFDFDTKNSNTDLHLFIFVFFEFSNNIQVNKSHQDLLLLRQHRVNSSYSFFALHFVDLVDSLTNNENQSLNEGILPIAEILFKEKSNFYYLFISLPWNIYTS